MDYIKYRVVTGDVLSAIARRYKTTVEVLSRINHLSEINHIRAGQTLDIPKPRAQEVMHLSKAKAHSPSGHALMAAKPEGSVPPPSPGLTTHTPEFSSSPHAHASSSMVALIGKKRTLAMAYGRVSNAGGVNLHTAPAMSGDVSRRLPFNTRLFINWLLSGDWYFATLEDGSAGYVYAKHVNIHPPEPEAFLHKIRHDESALQIVRQYYKGDAIQWGQDERYYVNVLTEANRGHSLRGIYNPSADADWAQTKTRENYLIWVPSLAFAKQLRGNVRSGSISHDLWQKAKHTAECGEDFLLGGAAFTAGLIHGALESVWDLLVGLVDLVKLAWKLVASILTGELISDLKHLWNLVKSIDFHALLDAGLNAFLERWNAPELLKRWHFRGWLMGYGAGNK